MAYNRPVALHGGNLPPQVNGKQRISLPHKKRHGAHLCRRPYTKASRRPKHGRPNSHINNGLYLPESADRVIHSEPTVNEACKLGRVAESYYEDFIRWDEW